MSTPAYSDKTRRTSPKVMPMGFIRVLIAVVLAALAFTAYARISDRPLASQTPDAPVAAEAVVVLRSNAATGEVWVTDEAGAQIAHYGQQGGGFLSTLHRVVLRERGKHKAREDAPVHLREHANGRLALYDPATGLNADLAGYGAGNRATVAELITTATNGGRTDGTANTGN